MGEFRIAEETYPGESCPFVQAIGTVLTGFTLRKTVC